jgi:hypothetical protein
MNNVDIEQIKLLDDHTIFKTKINSDTLTQQPYLIQASREEPRNTTLTVRFAF